VSKDRKFCTVRAKRPARNQQERERNLKHHQRFAKNKPWGAPGAADRKLQLSRHR
jgi:hypothetical protein